ncbi:MAG TPA: ATP-dependent DNA helicase RecG, partial [Deinococcales bacterium]|nr:ATP-dependent DNA helicase RecG [Deinococcales bacterium]
LKATWFNKPWIEKDLKAGARLLVTGKTKRFGRQLSIGVEYHEVEEGDGESLTTGRIIGVYPAQEGTSQDFIRKSVKKALDAVPDPGDYLSSKVRGQHGLTRLDQALQGAHFPPDDAALHAALKRLKFDEFLFLELRVLLQGSAGTLGKQFSAPDEEVARFEGILPFTFTGAQRRAVAEIVADMRTSRQMARLLQGDVGSGKTAVAACALYLATVDGLQGAMMAPTEILARQHFESLTRYLFPLGVRVELLTGAMTARERKLARERIASGEVQVVVGTQALIQEGVSFANLGLAVVDEEHRFGVMQRRALLADRPDVLVMSATPIPRSLALTAYGDLELTVIDELPPGRTPVKTKLVMDTYRTQAYHFVMQEVRAGRQAYVVTPLIEESEALAETLAATRLAEDLRMILPEARIDLLHGKMPPAEKDGVMNRFRAREFDILVSTTVIEVGVDVANATVMVIENAERFGLSQLHQLRGRVGRGAKQSYCVLIAGEHTKKTRERLKVIEASTDGFKIAEADLKLRGPGELRGTRQSGLDDLKLGDLSEDAGVIEEARNLAKEILAADPRLERPENAALRAELTARAEQVAVRDVI